MITTIHRKKINFMVDQQLIIELQEWIPQGERSDFVNTALAQAMLRYKRTKAFTKMDELRTRTNLHMSTAEILTRKNYGRK